MNYNSHHKIWLNTSLSCDNTMTFKKEKNDIDNNFNTIYYWLGKVNKVNK